MNRILMSFIYACIALAVFTGCRTDSIYDLVDSSVTTVSGKEPSLEQVRKAIVEAGGSLKWDMTDVQPGHLVGTLNLRSHQAVVDIKYNTKKYSITYKSSMNLNYDAEAKTIHSNYLSWIKNLDAAIRRGYLRLVHEEVGG
ncbi:MAG: hypothetical protein EXR96_00205 [Nitrospiraceae bacterium]|nr:hypothetical protein [Nitrospiraceae bacterium]